MDTKAFFGFDFQASLFPLKTNLVVIKNHHAALEKYIAKVLSTLPEHGGDCFLPQHRAHAAKPKNHLRRTAVLDPVASYFLYDLINRNRNSFGQEGAPTRRSFGYRFGNGRPIPIHKAYQDFNAQITKNRGKYDHVMSFDIASYFNSIYHHDAVNWFAALQAVSASDSDAFGKFFRQINAGRSIDFLPQGIYPSKMIGSEFLRFIDNSGQLKCAQSLRFMDDIYLFDDDDRTLINDFLRVQELLGLCALNVNPTKTTFDSPSTPVHELTSDIQKELAAIVDNRPVHLLYGGSGADGPWPYDDEYKRSLDDEQIERLLTLLVDPKVDETEVETILGVLHDHTESITTHIPQLIARFPNIVKQLHKLTGQITDKDLLTRQLIELIDADVPLIEYQLFWIAAMAEDHLCQTLDFGKLILKLYEKTSEHRIARAKILEIPDQSFGLKEIRDEILKSGTSDWPSWAAAAGARTLPKAARNHTLKYFAKGSSINGLVADCMQKLP